MRLKNIISGIFAVAMLTATVHAADLDTIYTRTQQISKEISSAENLEKLAGELVILITDGNVFEKLVDKNDFETATELKASADEALKAVSKSDKELAKIAVFNLCTGLNNAMGFLVGKGISFSDVMPDAWYYNAVMYTVSNGIFEGMGDGVFAPETAITRGMFLALMGRMYMGNGEKYSQAYTDVPDEQYYAKAVNWAKANGILFFIDSDNFQPDKAITREELVTVLKGCMEHNGIDTSFTATTEFKDKSSFLSWSEEAIAWAAQKNIVSGFEDNTFRPASTATRAQAAQIFLNLSKQ